MAGYEPLKIAGNSTGLVKYREEFLLPDDAYPVLENAFVWRERIKRKQGFELLARLRRVFVGPTAQNLGMTDGSGNFTGNIRSILGLQTTATIEVGSVIISDGTNTFTDNGLGVLVGAPGGSGTINYTTTDVTITGGAANAPLTLTYNYFPGLPVMGLRSRELTATNNEQMVAFDQVYAYRPVGDQFEEFLPGTVWTGSNSDFFWSTNYWVGDGNLKIFWVTNDVDPIRYTNGVPATNWVDFAPIINAAGDTLNLALCMLPFRGRMLAFNTVETDGSHPNRIRWGSIGNPFTVPSPIVTVVNAESWRDDIRGKGGFLDIPTSEDIITVGFVRDNLVIYCERSTWQLRYTGRSIAPFQIEKVNSELGVESTFSGIQFDTSLVGIGDKGVVECDSYQSERIDIKIVDLVIQDISNLLNGTKRVHGIRDFQQRLAFWTYPTIDPTTGVIPTFPNRRLVYNYENDSWAIFTDSLTVLGTYQKQTSRRWSDQPTIEWRQANFPWIDRAALFPSIMGGNQQGFVLYLDELTTNQESLYISNIQGFGTTNADPPIIITSPSHNLVVGNVISILNIPTGTPFASVLNGNIYAVAERIDDNNFTLGIYSPLTRQFSTPALAASGVYIGGGDIRVRDNFSITSKKFNYMDQGKQFQLGYIDVLFDASPNDVDITQDAAISLNIYNDYTETVSNQLPLNATNDTFFNQIVETTAGPGVNGGTKNWKRVFCATNCNFVTIEWTLNNEQMTNICQESDVQIDAQVIWRRVGGRLGITQ